MIAFASVKYGAHACRWLRAPPTSKIFHTIGFGTLVLVDTVKVCSTTPMVLSLALSTSSVKCEKADRTEQVTGSPSVGMYFLAVILSISFR